jgi:DNA invertase Pin-like site-specific DNA recombinase
MMMTAARRHDKRVGCIRVSSVDQHTDRQLEGQELDKVFTDRASGKDTKRPQLQACLDYIREGDVLVVHSMDRLARNLDDLRRMVLDLTGKGVHVRFVKENLTFTGEDSPSNLLLSLLGAVAEFERSMIRERQREGIAIAKKAGIYKGRKPSLSAEQVKEVCKRVVAGEQKTALAAEYGISRQTPYSALVCGGGKSLARKLLCGAECVMDSKWSDADGKAQVRFHSGGASADDVSLYSKRLAEPEHRTAPGATRGVHVRGFMRPLNRAGCGISPHTMPEREILTKPEKSRARLNVAACSINYNSARERLLIVIVSLGAQDGLQYRRPYHRRPQADLDVHLHGALMTNYGLRSPLMAFRSSALVITRRSQRARHPGRFVHPKCDAAGLPHTQLDQWRTSHRGWPE